MCLAVPGKITDFYEVGGVAMARVDFAGVSREACMAYLPEVQAGDYVLVHAGFAISRVDAEQAERTLEDLRRMEELAEVDEEPPGS